MPSCLASPLNLYFSKKAPIIVRLLSCLPSSLRREEESQRDRRKNLMGSDGGCVRPNGCQFNGILPNKAASLTRVLDMERWRKAEERTAELIAHIQPDQSSLENRNAVASYVQRLISNCVPCVVFIYGSVPLKTYLPDGDIDLTVFSEDQTSNDKCAAKVCNILETEGNNKDAEYQIKEVQLICAEVKLVKCLVNNIVVDISFNQLGGLSTLCFLEQADEYINQNHLFKRSIILIKAWCYYESRLLGAYHGLISTYALETLILYIFHVFNSTFAGPLEVLYRFLLFFSNFDWDNFCISLQGPVPIRSLPDMSADPPRKDGDALFLSKRFLDTCTSYYSVHPSTTEIKEQFGSKNFNIIDFLRMNNNLGRSVSRGNLFRIRTAFTFGAKRLAGLLDCPKENVVTELNRFFMNTWDMNWKVLRPDRHSVHASGFMHRGQTQSGKLVNDPGLWVYDASSVIKDNLENGLFSEYTEKMQNLTSAQSNVYCHSEDRKQDELMIGNGDSVGKYGVGKWKDASLLTSNNPLDDRLWKAFTMDRSNAFHHFCHEVNGGKDGIPFSNSVTKILPNGALYTCTPTSLCFPAPDWVHITPVPHPCSWPTAVHNRSPFPVTSLPGGPCVADTHPNLTYSKQREGKGATNIFVSHHGSTLDTADSVHWPDYSGQSKVCTFDILSGDLASHLSNMLYARSCQNSNFKSPFLVPVRYLEEQYMPNDPGTSSKFGSPCVVNYTVMPETAMPILGHYSAETSLANGYMHCPKGIMRYSMETGTSTPDLKSCRDSSSSKNLRGNNRYYRKEQPKEREVGVARNNRAHMQWKVSGEGSFGQAKR